MADERQVAASRMIAAFGVVALWVIGFFLAGSPPKFDGTPEERGSTTTRTTTSRR